MSEVNTRFFQSFRDEYGLTAFIETGCAHGKGVMAARQAGFERIYTCDVTKEACQLAQNTVPQAFVSLEDSADFLMRFDTDAFRLEHKCLFWLDAHFPVNPDVQAANTPIRSELGIIRRIRGEAIRHDVILVDDMRMIAGDDNPRYREGELDREGHGDKVVRSFSLTDLIRPFTMLTQDHPKATHSWRIDNSQPGDSGILVLAPLGIR